MNLQKLLSLRRFFSKLTDFRRNSLKIFHIFAISLWKKYKILIKIDEKLKDFNLQMSYYVWTDERPGGRTLKNFLSDIDLEIYQVQKYERTKVFYRWLNRAQTRWLNRAQTPGLTVLTSIRVRLGPSETRTPSTAEWSCIELTWFLEIDLRYGPSKDDSFRPDWFNGLASPVMKLNR